MAAFTNASGEQYVSEIQWNGYDANLKPEVVDVLNKAQSLVDFPIVLNSGYRSPSRNKAAGGAKKSQHLTGNAVDISVKGLTNAQRTQLTRALAQAGANRLGVYSGNTAIHLDLAKGYGTPKGYSVYPMYDRSFNNMSRAPSWFTSGLDGGMIPPGAIPDVASAVDAINNVFPKSLTDNVSKQRLAYADATNVPLPRHRPGTIPSAYDSPRTATQVANLYEGILPRRSVDSQVGITGLPVTARFDGQAITDPRPPLDWAMFRPGVSAGGLGSLLSGGVSPAAPNPTKAPVQGLRLPTLPTTVTGRPDAPTGSLPAARPPTAPTLTQAQRNAMLSVAGTSLAPQQSIIRTGQGIAGAVALPRDVRPNVAMPTVAPPRLNGAPVSQSNAATLAAARAEQTEQRSNPVRTTSSGLPLPKPLNVSTAAPMAPVPLTRPTTAGTKTVTSTVTNPAYTAWVKQYGTSPVNPVAVNKLQDIHDKQAAALGYGPIAPIPATRPVPPAPPKTIQVTKQVPMAPVPLARPVAKPVVAPIPLTRPQTTLFSAGGSLYAKTPTGQPVYVGSAAQYNAINSSQKTGRDPEAESGHSFFKSGFGGGGGGSSMMSG